METNHLITGIEVKDILKTDVPCMNIERSNEANLFKIIDGFADYTINLIKKGNLTGIKNCFNTAERLLSDGSSDVKLAIENIFVFSVTIFFDMGNAVSGQVKELLPSNLMEEYHKQVSSCQP